VALLAIPAVLAADVFEKQYRKRRAMQQKSQCR